MAQINFSPVVLNDANRHLKNHQIYLLILIKYIIKTMRPKQINYFLSACVYW